jgi:hypothetical protein
VENFVRMEKWIFDSPDVPAATFRQEENGGSEDPETSTVEKAETEKAPSVKKSTPKKKAASRKTKAGRT